MAKFFGIIGYVKTIETSPGVFTEDRTERNYSGDVIRNSRRWQEGENLNDNLIVDNTISIVSDSFADENFYKMRYIQWMGAFWKISKVDIQKPRLILTLGEVYNGKTGPTTVSP